MNRTIGATGKQRARFLVAIAITATFVVSTAAFARVAEVFEGEGRSAFTASSEMADQVVAKPFSNVMELECLLEYIGDEYPEVLACIDSADRGEMLQLVVLRPGGGALAAGAAGALPRPASRYLGAYERSADSTENLDGLDYYFEK